MARTPTGTQFRRGPGLALGALLALAVMTSSCSSRHAGGDVPQAGTSPVLGDSGGQSGGGTGAARGSTLASVRVSGDIQATLALRELARPYVFNPPPGGLSVTWTDGSGNVFGLGTPAFEGTERTGDARVVTLNVMRGSAGPGTFLSQGGDCTITIDRVTSTTVEGSAACRHMESLVGEVRVDVRARFAATVPEGSSGLP
jgi:hypothetical protein